MKSKQRDKWRLRIRRLHGRGGSFPTKVERLRWRRKFSSLSSPDQHEIGRLDHETRKQLGCYRSADCDVDSLIPLIDPRFDHGLGIRSEADILLRFLRRDPDQEYVEFEILNRRLEKIGSGSRNIEERKSHYFALDFWGEGSCDWVDFGLDMLPSVLVDNDLMPSSVVEAIDGEEWERESLSKGGRKLLKQLKAQRKEQRS